MNQAACDQVACAEIARIKAAVAARFDIIVLLQRAELLKEPPL